MSNCTMCQRNLADWQELGVPSAPICAQCSFTLVKNGLPENLETIVKLGESIIMGKMSVEQACLDLAHGKC